MYLLRLNYNGYPFSYEGTSDKNNFNFTSIKLLYNPFERQQGGIDTDIHEIYDENEDLSDWLFNFKDRERRESRIGYNFFFRKLEHLQRANVLYLFSLIL